jgi:hypothetical protein
VKREAALRQKVMEKFPSSFSFSQVDRKGSSVAIG